MQIDLEQTSAPLPQAVKYLHLFKVNLSYS